MDNYFLDSQNKGKIHKDILGGNMFLFFLFCFFNPKFLWAAGRTPPSWLVGLDTDITALIGSITFGICPLFHACTKCPKIYRNLYCISLSIDLRYT